MRQREPISFFHKWTLRSLSPICAISMCGCQRAPSFNIVGSFFPAWIFCVVLGIILAALARAFFIRMNFDHEIKPSVLIYPCIAASCALTMWLIFVG